MTTVSFKTYIIRYNIIGDNLMYSDYILDKLESKYQTLQEYMYAISICFDYNVVQLFSLLEAHQKMTHLKTYYEIQKLEDSLSDAWKVVDAQKVSNMYMEK